MKRNVTLFLPRRQPRDKDRQVEAHVHAIVQARDRHIAQSSQLNVNECTWPSARQGCCKWYLLPLPALQEVRRTRRLEDEATNSVYTRTSTIYVYGNGLCGFRASELPLLGCCGSYVLRDTRLIFAWQPCSDFSDVDYPPSATLSIHRRMYNQKKHARKQEGAGPFSRTWLLLWAIRVRRCQSGQLRVLS